MKQTRLPAGKEQAIISIYEKRDLILEHEERFAALLAREVPAAPKMNIWMVFIPFILIYHMIQHRRVMEGRKVFIRNYLQSRKRALEESLISVERGGSPEIEKMLKEFSHSTTSFPTCDYVRDLIDQVSCPHYHRPRKDPNKEKRK